MRETGPDPRCHCIYLLHSRNFRYATVLTFSLLLIGFTVSYAFIEAGDKVGADSRLLENLPPDPGSAGKLTLEGIDSDNDGVRDDIQRWIAITYPDSQKTREVIRQYVIAVQTFLLNANDPDLSFNNALQSSRGLYCSYYVDPENAGDFLGEVLAKVLNTDLRSKVYLQANRHLSGKFFSTPADLKTGCDFDPDAMPN